MDIGLSHEDRKNLILNPMMANKLNQAIGRLIRSINDYGIITILDCRIFRTKYYDNFGRYVQNLLCNQGYDFSYYTTIFTENSYVYL
ncbi:helicase C-terminal domain-containing protein [Bacillus thuringiensis]|uniref:helicase C-terminal domain-containing protein n=1 Tax=Bacillus thuringiensis TaxID=1428 RepID=UPI001048485E|nr:helicase C-terminal domain-containing protein [Bacillus thuringiensis]